MGGASFVSIDGPVASRTRLQGTHRGISPIHLFNPSLLQITKDPCSFLNHVVYFEHLTGVKCVGLVDSGTVVGHFAHYDVTVSLSSVVYISAEGNSILIVRVPFFNDFVGDGAF